MSKEDDIDRILGGIKPPEGYTLYVCKEHGRMMVQDTSPDFHCVHCSQPMLPGDHEDAIKWIGREERRKARKDRVRKLRNYLEG